MRMENLRAAPSVMVRILVSILKEVRTENMRLLRGCSNLALDHNKLLNTSSLSEASTWQLTPLFIEGRIFWERTNDTATWVATHAENFTRWSLPQVRLWRTVKRVWLQLSCMQRLFSTPPNSGWARKLIEPASRTFLATLPSKHSPLVSRCPALCSAEQVYAVSAETV